MLSQLLSATDLGRAVNEVAARVRTSVVEVRSRGGSGSGTIWRSGGTIITNHHVVPGDSAEITLEQGGTYRAEVAARDPRNDIAILQTDQTDLPAAGIGDARRLRPGELVLAVGNPVGLRGAVTVGVVSQPLPTSHAGRGRELVQADVLLGPGSSGGPLVNARGHVVGINSMVYGGLALAVPSHVVERLLCTGGTRPLLGITAQEVATPANGVTAGHRPPGRALLISHVEPESAAERAGLLLGDVLYAVGDGPLEGSASLLNALDSHGAGPLRLGIFRGGVPQEILVFFAPQAAPALVA